MPGADPFDHLGPGVRAHLTDRHGGASIGAFASLNLAFHVGDDPAVVVENRARVCRRLGVEALTIPDQVHEARVAVVDAGLAGAGHGSLEDARERLGGTDSLVTDVPGVAVAILVADCQPLVLWDPVHRAVAVVHAGRLGTIRGVVPATVERLAAEYGTDPRDLLVGIGPHVGPLTYEVGHDEVADFVDRFGTDLVHPTRDDRASLDLEGAVRRQLRDAGVPEVAVRSTGIDTTAATDRWFSDRATRPCGRFGLVAIVEPPVA